MDSFTYTSPRTSKDVTVLHQWNLENAAGWGGASPEAFVGNKYANSPKMKADTCYTSTFDDPENEFFTSITAYDNDKYLMGGAATSTHILGLRIATAQSPYRLTAANSQKIILTHKVMTLPSPPVTTA